MAAGASLTTSVAMATYNGERYLARQLESLTRQTVLPDELVVTDDGSTDDTVNLLGRFARTAAFPVRLHVNSERLGFKRNFRRAIQLCTYEIIFFCDQDDVWAPRKIERMLAPFSIPDVLVAYHGAALTDAAERRYGSLHVPAVEIGILAQQPVHPWHLAYGLTQAMRSSLRAFDDLWDVGHNHLMHDDILAHDQWYIFLAMALGEVAYVNEELVLYRQHSSNTVGAMGPRTAWGRLVSRFIHRAETDALGCLAAESRAEIMRLIAARSPAAMRDRLSEIAERYEVLAGRLARRHSTYTKLSAAERLSALGTSIVAGDYVGNPWAFDWRSIPRDFVTGVIRGGRNA